MSGATSDREGEEAPFDFLEQALQDMFNEDLLLGVFRGPAAVRLMDGGSPFVADHVTLLDEGSNANRRGLQEELPAAHGQRRLHSPSPPPSIPRGHRFVPLEERRGGWLFSSSDESDPPPRPSFQIRAVEREGQQHYLPIYNAGADGTLTGSSPPSIDSDASAAYRAFPPQSPDARLPVLSIDDVVAGLEDWVANTEPAPPAEISNDNEDAPVITLPEIPGQDPLTDILRELNIEEVPWDNICVEGNNIVIPQQSPPGSPGSVTSAHSTGSPGSEYSLRSPIHMVIGDRDRLVSPPPDFPQVWFVSSPVESEDSGDNGENNQGSEKEENDKNNDSDADSNNSNTHSNSTMTSDEEEEEDKETDSTPSCSGPRMDDIWDSLVTKKSKVRCKICKNFFFIIGHVDNYICEDCFLNDNELGPNDFNNVGNHKNHIRNKANVVNYDKIEIGNLPLINTRDSAVNSIISKGTNIFLPKNFHCHDYTPLKNLPHVKRLEEAGVLREVPPSCRPLATFTLFTVPKAEPSNPRVLLDMSPLTGKVKAPSFKLPTINPIFPYAKDPSNFMVKLDLTNGFFHIKLSDKASKLLGVKCGGKYYSLRRLPQGLTTSPYIMQRVIKAVVGTLLEGLELKIAIYLDDILLVGRKEVLIQATKLLLNSSLLFNKRKCSLLPSRSITYLGININFDTYSVALSDRFIGSLRGELFKLRDRRCSLKNRQRIAGLINFAIPILGLPLNLVHLAFVYPHKMFKFASLFHTDQVTFYQTLNRSCIFVDATPDHIGLWDPGGRRGFVFRCRLPILEAEFAAAWLAHILFPGAVIFSDNQAVIFLLSKGKLPPGWRNSYKKTVLLCRTYHSPTMVYVRSSSNPADRFSRPVTLQN